MSIGLSRHRCVGRRGGAKVAETRHGDHADALPGQRAREGNTLVVATAAAVNSQQRHRFRSLGSIGPQGVSNSPLPCAARARARARCKSLPNHEPVRSAAPTSARANTARTPWRVKIFKTTRRGRRAPESDSRAEAAKGHHSVARRPNPGAARAHEGAAHRCCPFWSPTPSQSPTATVASACTRVVNAYQITLLWTPI